ncbi:hypothetical protein [Desulfobulbus alkaliphilus]|uniref:hypothetical protein n=1 Tax=Desulfobulbus alkaliphilus TaxID=869814 RepID=UPI0019652E0F|nr:hypothetical protein [Desulfobulbus alkaliphilus]MBM9538652.1 hypothetical protein [Desulfobulbus alkaliphilus]
METYWVPGVNYLGNYDRWTFAEFTEVYRIESDFEVRVTATKYLNALTEGGFLEKRKISRSNYHINLALNAIVTRENLRGE